MEHKCPRCNRVIASRRNVLCGYCGQRLPDELLFTSEERAKVEKELEEAKRRAREAMKVPFPDYGPSEGAGTI